MLGLAGLAFAACSNDEEGIGAGGNDDAKTLVISISGISSGTTKAASPEDAWSAETSETDAIKNISKIGLLFTDDNGLILYKYQLEKQEGDGNAAKQWSALVGTNATGLRFVGLTGVTQVHAIANVDITSWTAVNNSQGSTSTGANIYTQTQTFQTNLGLGISKSGVVYVGSDKTITPYQPEPATGVDEDLDVTLPNAGESGNFYYSAEIKLVPIMSRIQIKSIEIATSGSIEFGPTDDTDKYTLTWSKFKPQLHGVYLNNFANTYTLFNGASSDWKKNTSYSGNMKDGQWLFGQDDYEDDAAYVSYTSSKYGELLEYGSENADTKLTPLTIGDNKCIGFNIFVPFDPANYNTANGNTADATNNQNPTIHFQFSTPTDYNYTITLTDNPETELSETDQAFINTSIALNYRLPSISDGMYLMANISTLYGPNDANKQTELVLNPGMIYNMDKVVITPVNMTTDFDNPQSTNVIVTITVLPFSEATIYPGLD